MADDVGSAYNDLRAKQLKEQEDRDIAMLRQSTIPNIDVIGTLPDKPIQKSKTMGIGEAAWNGLKGAAENTLNGIDDLGNWLNDNILNLRTEQEQKAYELTGRSSWVLGNADLGVEKPSEDSGFTPKVAFNATEFLAGFIPALRATRLLAGGAAVTKAGMVMEGAAASTGSFFTLNPEEERLSAMINEKLPQELRNPVMDYLAGSPEDSKLDARFKNMLENVGFGIAGDLALNGIFKSIKMYKDSMRESGLDPLMAIKEHATKIQTHDSLRTELDGILTAADEAAAKGAKQGEVNISKELGVHLNSTGQTFDLESLRNARKALDTPVVQHQVTEETAGVLPKAAADAPTITLHSTPDELKSVVDKMVRGEHLEADATKGIDFNFNRMDTSEDIGHVLNTFSESLKPTIQETTRGKVPLNLIKDVAESIGSRVENIELLYKNTGMLAERMTAGRIMLNKSADAMLRMAQGVREMSVKQFATVEEREQAMATSLLALRKQAMVHGEIQAQLKGTQTEIARAMSAMRITTADARFSRGELNSLLEHFGGEKLNLEFANKLVSLADNPNALNKMVRKSNWVRSMDMLQEVWTNSILSGPITHATNIIGNSLRAIGGVAETAIAAGIGKTRRMFGSEVASAEFGEAVAQAHGLMEGLMDVIKLTREGRFNEVGSFGGGKIDGGAFFEPAITAGNLGLNADTKLGMLSNFVGSTFRLPGAALQVEDNFFKQLNVRASLRANSYRIARQEGKMGDDLAKRMADLLDEMPDSLLDKAHQDALEAVFAKSLEADGGILDRMGIWLQTAKNEGLNGKPLVPGLHFIVPFIKTPTNILKYSWDHMPALGLIGEHNRAILSAGGREADLLLAKQTTGGIALALGAYLASQGAITGSLPQLTKDQKEVAGIQPYSIKIGDRWVAFNRVDPIGMFLGLAADGANLYQHRDQFTTSQWALGAVSAVAQGLASKTYLQGIFGIINAIDDSVKGDSKGLEKWAAGMVNGILPFAGLRTQTMKAVDDNVMHEINGFSDRILATLPGFSKDIPPHRNLLTGDPVVYEGGLGADIASPFYTKTQVDDPVANEISRLRWTGFQHPPKRFNGVDLTAQQYDRLMTIMTKELGGEGNTMQDQMRQLVTSDQWKDLTDGAVDYDADTFDIGSRQFALNKIFNNFKRGAYQQLMNEDPTFMEKVTGRKIKKKESFLGIPIQDAANQ